MHNISFIASFGDYDEQVSLDWMLMGTYEINIGGYYYGSIVHYYQKGWTVVFQNDYYRDKNNREIKHCLTLDDKDAILDRAADQLASYR